MMVVVTGASGSGKSEYAEGVAVSWREKETYIILRRCVSMEKREYAVWNGTENFAPGKDFKRLSVLSRWMKRLHRYACQSLWNRHVTYHMEEYVRQNF